MRYRMFTRRILLTICLLATAAAETLAASLFAMPDSSFYQRYPYIRLMPQGQDSNISDELTFSDAGKVEFPANRYELPQNDSVLAELVSIVIPQIRKDSLKLLRISLSGAASPEGPIANNEWLSKKRMEALYDFIVKQLAYPQTEQYISTDYHIEDYTTLCLMMQKAGDSDYERVRQLCDKYMPTLDNYKLKKELQNADGGRLWQRLKSQYFPQLRAARFMLFFRKPNEPNEPHEPYKAYMPHKAHKPYETAIASAAQQPPRHRRELLSVKTNMLFYGAYVPFGYDRFCPIPNVAIEYYPKGGHFTVGASLDFPWWKNYEKHKFFEIRNWQLEGRYYLRSGSLKKNPPGQGPAFRGFYISAYAHYFIYEIGLNKDRGYKGEGFGGGLGVGYVMPLSRKGHWRLEMGVQAGVFTTKYDPFQYENLINLNYHDGLYYYRWTGRAADFRLRQYRYNWFGPTRVGLTLTYDLLYRKNGRRGFSFRPNEPQRKGGSTR